MPADKISKERSTMTEKERENRSSKWREQTVERLRAHGLPAGSVDSTNKEIIDKHKVTGHESAKMADKERPRQKSCPFEKSPNGNCE